MQFSYRFYSLFERINPGHLCLVLRQISLQIAFDVSKDLFVDHIFPGTGLLLVFGSRGNRGRRLCSLFFFLLFDLLYGFEFQRLIGRREILAVCRSHHLSLDLDYISLRLVLIYISIFSGWNSVWL